MTKATNTARPLKRLAASGIDWLLIAMYGLCLFGVVTTFGVTTELTHPYNALWFQLVGFISMTLPVIVYFIASEYFFGQTLGKKVMSIQIVSLSGSRLELRQLVLRNGIKFLPWEIAHYCVHQFVASNLAKTDPSMQVILLLIGVYALAGLYLALLFWRKDHRTPYDHLAGTRVTSNR